MIPIAKPYLTTDEAQAAICGLSAMESRPFRLGAPVGFPRNIDYNHWDEWGRIKLLRRGG